MSFPDELVQVLKPRKYPGSADPGANTVWLIGAGFSASLGGPLLRQMFRREHASDIEAYFPSEGFGNLAEYIRRVQALYHVGSKERLWADPEQFLAYADDALAGGGQPGTGPKRDVLRSALCRAIKDDFEFFEGKTGVSDTHISSIVAKLLLTDLSGNIRRALAAECSKFVRDRDVSSELWSPYVTWTQTLNPKLDTIVGFN